MGDLMIVLVVAAMICTAFVVVEALAKWAGLDRWVDDQPVEYTPVDHDPTGGAR